MTIGNLAVYIAGGLAGYGLWHLFRRLPTRWLLEYGETEVPADLTAVQKARRGLDALILIALGAGFAGLAWSRLPHFPDFLFSSLSAAILLLIILADWKTLIIPDPLTLGLITLSAFSALIATLSGTNTWLALGWRLAAGLLAGGLFWLIGWIGEKLAGQEAMGMGDVKLIAACVWLVDYPKAFALIMIAFLIASLFAFPMLIQKYTAKQDPSEDRPAAMLPFGPFIAIATLVVQVLSPELHLIWSFYLGQF